MSFLLYQQKSDLAYILFDMHNDIAAKFETMDWILNETLELLLGTIVAEILDSTDYTSTEPVSQFSNIAFSTEKSHRVAIIDGEVQAFEKHNAIKTCLDLV